ncbi:uncharacterized protein LOC111487659 isoform X2 [Cucurbita maxima]|uniref:Uncharacterized protein LOC111487659 isoform X2 n=2 Tax=Cucurbita TaxID=3660 RepID=A0A6J1JRE2_CUCMA|nr:uncharacterized protein LOC111487659 isoform X2 [Cucurbita maxima]
MEGVEMELERRTKFLNGLILKKKAVEQQDQPHPPLNVRVRASDMSFPLQNRAFTSARQLLDSMPAKLDTKRLALALKKDQAIVDGFSRIRFLLWSCLALHCGNLLWLLCNTFSRWLLVFFNR